MLYNSIRCAFIPIWLDRDGVKMDAVMTGRKLWKKVALWHIVELA